MSDALRSHTHPYICECRRICCRERLYLTRAEYVALARRGLVMSAACAARDGRLVLASTNGTTAVRSTRIVL